MEVLTQSAKKDAHFRLTLITCIILGLLAVGLLASLVWPRTSRDEAAAAWLRANAGSEQTQPLGGDEDAEAKSIAARFLKGLGKTASQPEQGEKVQMPLVGARWRVSYGNATTVEIDPQDKEVVYLLDRTAVALDARSVQSTSPRLADADVVQRARESLGRIGLTLDEGQIARVSLTQQGDTPLVLLKFPRVDDGYPFWDDAIAVMINRQDGSLYSFNKLYSSGSISGTVRLSTSDATSRALTFLETADKAKGFQPGPTSGEVMYVHPNDYWTAKPRLEGGDARLAYVVRVRNAQAGGMPVECIVWIDAEDGRVLGGTRSQ